MGKSGFHISLFTFHIPLIKGHEARVKIREHHSPAPNPESRIPNPYLIRSDLFYLFMDLCPFFIEPFNAGAEPAVFNIN